MGFENSRFERMVKSNLHRNSLLISSKEDTVMKSCKKQLNKQVCMAHGCFRKKLPSKKQCINYFSVVMGTEVRLMCPSKMVVPKDVICVQSGDAFTFKMDICD